MNIEKIKCGIWRMFQYIVEHNVLFGHSDWDLCYFTSYDQFVNITNRVNVKIDFSHSAGDLQDLQRCKRRVVLVTLPTIHISKIG